MSERIILRDCCGNNNSNEVAITNGSTFKLTYHLTPLGQTDNQAVNLDSLDFRATFWILGYDNELIDFVKPSISDDTVIVDKAKSQVTFLFRNYNLKTGKLYQYLEFKISDSSVPGQWALENYEGFTGITIK